MTKNDIRDAVCENQFAEEANMKVQISLLRISLAENKDDIRFLLTVPRKGDKFVADLNPGINKMVLEKHLLSRPVIEGNKETDKGKFYLINFPPSLKTTMVVFGFCWLWLSGFLILKFENDKSSV